MMRFLRQRILCSVVAEILGFLRSRQYSALPGNEFGPRMSYGRGHNVSAQLTFGRGGHGSAALPLHIATGIQHKTDFAGASRLMARNLLISC